VQEELVAKAARELWKNKSRGTVKSAEWSESDRLLMFCGKIYVPNDRDLRHRIVEQHHDTCIARHAGRCKGNLTDLRRILHLSLAKGNPKRTL
jgi:hypothetical protein